MSFKNLEGQPTHWIQHLQEYNFTSEHSESWKHNNTDAFPWWPCWEECIHSNKVDAWADIKQTWAITAVAAAHSEGSRDQTLLRMERYCWPQHLLQKLLGPMEILRCEKRHTRAPLGLHWQMI
jgi:hypothetical protein